MPVQTDEASERREAAGRGVAVEAACALTALGLLGLNVAMSSVEMYPGGVLALPTGWMVGVSVKRTWEAVQVYLGDGVVEQVVPLGQD